MTAKGLVLSDPVMISTISMLCHGKFVSQLGNTLGDTNKILKQTFSPESDVCLSDIKTSHDIFHWIHVSSLVRWQRLRQQLNFKVKWHYVIWLCLRRSQQAQTVCTAPGHMCGENSEAQSYSMFMCLLNRWRENLNKWAEKHNQCGSFHKRTKAHLLVYWKICDSYTIAFTVTTSQLNRTSMGEPLDNISAMTKIYI